MTSAGSLISPHLTTTPMTYAATDEEGNGYDSIESARSEFGSE
jgi:hypothetical protein